MEKREGEQPRMIWGGYGFISPVVLVILVAVQAGIYEGSARAGDAWVGIYVGAVLLLVLVPFLWVRVDVTEEGVHVRLGPLGYPRFFRSFDEIETAEVLRVHPLRFGGWGYRWISGGYAVILRGGSAIDLKLTGGRRFVVTANRAHEGVAHINQIVVQRRAERRAKGEPYIV